MSVYKRLEGKGKIFFNLLGFFARCVSIYDNEMEGDDTRREK
jgi:hypothetical protein